MCGLTTQLPSAPARRSRLSCTPRSQVLRRFRITEMSISPTPDVRVAVLSGTVRSERVRQLLAHPSAALSALKALAPCARIVAQCTLASLHSPTFMRITLSDDEWQTIGREQLLTLTNAAEHRALAERPEGDCRTIVSRNALRLKLVCEEEVAVYLEAAGQSAVWLQDADQVLHYGTAHLRVADGEQVHTAIDLSDGQPRVFERAFSFALRHGHNTSPASWRHSTPEVPRPFRKLVVYGNKRSRDDERDDERDARAG